MLLIKHYSSWYRLKEAVAVFLRVRNMLLRRRANRKRTKDEGYSIEPQPQKNNPDLRYSLLTAHELEDAETAIFTFLQSQVFSNEIHALNRVRNDDEVERGRSRQKKMEVKKTSSLFRLDPFLDQSFIRIGGRLSRAGIPAEAKHLVILPRRSHVTTLIIRHIHEQLGQAGRGHVLAKLREKYWIVGVNAAVRHLIAECITCHRNRALPSQQKMADLLLLLLLLLNLLLLSS